MRQTPKMTTLRGAQENGAYLGLWCIGLWKKATLKGEGTHSFQNQMPMWTPFQPFLSIISSFSPLCWGGTWDDLCFFFLKKQPGRFSPSAFAFSPFTAAGASAFVFASGLVEVWTSTDFFAEPVAHGEGTSTASGTSSIWDAMNHEPRTIKKLPVKK